MFRITLISLLAASFTFSASASDFLNNELYRIESPDHQLSASRLVVNQSLNLSPTELNAAMVNRTSNQTAADESFAASNPGVGIGGGEPACLGCLGNGGGAPGVGFQLGQ